MKINIIDRSLPKAMIFILLMSSLIQVVSLEKYLIKVGPSYTDIKKGCGYEGYNPYFTSKIPKMRHHQATLELNAIDSALTSTEMAISYGILESAGQAKDALKEGPWKTLVDRAKGTWTESFRKVKELGVVKAITISKWAKPLLKGAMSFGKIMSPALGIFITAMEAATAAQTPTAEQILDATNKALKMITKEIDIKIKEVKKFVNESIIKFEELMLSNTYKELFKGWTLCNDGNRLEQEEINKCQMTSYDEIFKKKDTFLVANTKFQWTKNDVQSGYFHRITDSERRRLEINMVNFREYAMLYILSLNTLTASYDLERQIEIEKDKDSNGSSVFTCEELLRLKKNSEYVPPPKLNRYCKNKEKLLENAKYFEAYGNAAVEEILTLSKSRTSAGVEEMSREHSKTGFNADSSDWFNLIVDFVAKVHHVSCEARIHPVKEESCKYKIDMVEKPELGERYGDITQKQKDGWAGFIEEKIKYRYVEWETTADRREYYGMNNASEICTALVTNRQKDYRRQEQFEIKLYWNREVMKVVTCGRLLIEGLVTNCNETTLRNKNLAAFEEVIKFKKNTFSGYGITDFDRAADGLLSTTTKLKLGHSRRGEIPVNLEKHPYWTGELEEKVNITGIEIYIDKHERSYQGAWGKLYDVSNEKYYDPLLVYKRRDGNFVFIASWHGYQSYYIVAMTTNDGVFVKGGYVHYDKYVNGLDADIEDWWYLAENQWTNYDVRIENFRKFHSGNFSGLQVEVGTKEAADWSTVNWKICNTATGLEKKLPFIEKPLKVTCKKEFTDVNAIKIKVTDDKVAELMLAEVIVLGIPPLKETETDSNSVDETTINLKAAKHSKENSREGGNAFAAIDGGFITFSETGEEDRNWWKGTFDGEAVVKEIWLDLIGTYEAVLAEVSSSEDEDREWIQCDTYFKDLSRQVMKRECVTPDPVKYVRITAQSKSELGKSVLKIREVIVKGRYVNEDGEENINYIDELDNFAKAVVVKIKDGGSKSI